MKVFVKQAYDDFEVDSDATGLRCDDVSLAIQSSVDETDINTIVGRFGLTGQLPSNVRVPEFGDFTEVVDFQTAMNVVAMSQEAFDAMPANVRSRFENDPGKFMDFVLDEANREEARKLGLLMPGDPLEAVVPAIVPGAVRPPV